MTATYSRRGTKPNRAAGARTRQPRTPNVHISFPWRFKHHQNSTEGPTRETQKERNGGGRGKKKRENFGLPTLLSPTLRGPTLRHPNFGQSRSIKVAKVGLAKVGLAKVGLAKVGLAKVGLAKVGLAKVGLAKVGLSPHSCVCRAPCMPSRCTHVTLHVAMHLLKRLSKKKEDIMADRSSRGGTTKKKQPEIHLHRWQNDKICRISQLVHGSTEECPVF